MRTILASASPRRKELLSCIGMEYEVHPAKGEEHYTEQRPEEVVCELSRQKALEVASEYQNEDEITILGADTIVSVDDTILGKPVDREDAIRMLRMIAGRKHDVYTGVTIVKKTGGKESIKTFSEKTEVEVYPMTQAEMEAYADTLEPMDKAGAYAIQGRFCAYVKGIQGEYANVVGLPVARLCQELRNWGQD